MPLYIHLTNLIIPKSEVQKHYKGGLTAFRERFFWEGCRNQEDDELFGIAAMNPDELPIDHLKDNGMQPVFVAGNYDIVFKYGAKSSVKWLTVKTPFLWHKDCSPYQKEKALSVNTLTMGEIAQEAEKGNNLLATISS